MHNEKLILLIRIGAGFLIFCLTILYLLGQEKNMTINYKNQELKKDLTALQKETKALYIQTQIAINYDQVEKKATEELNMEFPQQIKFIYAK